MIDYDKMTRNFLLGEEKTLSPSILSYVQALNEIVNNFKAHTQKEARNIEIARQHLREIKRAANRLISENKTLQEKLQLLEESEE